MEAEEGLEDDEGIEAVVDSGDVGEDSCWLLLISAVLGGVGFSSCAGTAVLWPGHVTALL